MQWYKHDANANMDAKLQEVLLDYGLEGYGLYWYCLELIVGKVDKDNVTFELEHDCRMIAKNTGSTVQKVQEMMQKMVQLGLFEQSNGAITCLKIAKRLDKSMTNSPKMRELLNNIKALDAGGAKCTNVMTSSDNVMQDIDKNRLDIDIDIDNKEISATALPIVDQVEVSFNHFWQAGMRKVNKKKALSAYRTQFKANKAEIKKSVDEDHEIYFAEYLACDIVRRLELGQLGFAEMHPTTYLNGERWNDDYPPQQSTDFTGQQSVANWADGLENEFHGVNK